MKETEWRPALTWVIFISIRISMSSARLLRLLRRLIERVARLGWPGLIVLSSGIELRACEKESEDDLFDRIDIRNAGLGALNPL